MSIEIILRFLFDGERSFDLSQLKELLPSCEIKLHRKGKAPKNVDRVDKAHNNTGKPHVHFKDGTSLNQDGSIHDAHNGTPDLSNEVKEWLLNNGWSIGE